MPDRYRFGDPKDDLETYVDGSIVPHRFQYVERRKGFN